MQAYREVVTVVGSQILLNLPEEFEDEEVEVLVLTKSTKNKEPSIGKIGFVSQSFAEDDEDYSKW